MTELDNIKVVDDREPQRILQIEALTYTIRRLQAAEICLRDAGREDELSDRIKMKIKLAGDDVRKSIAECHAKLSKLDPEIAAFEQREQDLQKQRNKRKQNKEQVEA